MSEKAKFGNRGGGAGGEGGPGPGGSRKELDGQSSRQLAPGRVEALGPQRPGQGNRQGAPAGVEPGGRADCTPNTIARFDVCRERPGGRGRPGP